MDYETALKNSRRYTKLNYIQNNNNSNNNKNIKTRNRNIIEFTPPHRHSDSKIVKANVSKMFFPVNNDNNKKTFRKIYYIEQTL